MGEEDSLIAGTKPRAIDEDTSIDESRRMWRDIHRAGRTIRRDATSLQQGKLLWSHIRSRASGRVPTTLRPSELHRLTAPWNAVSAISSTTGPRPPAMTSSPYATSQASRSSALITDSNNLPKRALPPSRDTPSSSSWGRDIPPAMTVRRTSVRAAMMGSASLRRLLPEHPLSLPGRKEPGRRCGPYPSRKDGTRRATFADSLPSKTRDYHQGALNTSTNKFLCGMNRFVIAVMTHIRNNPQPAHGVPNERS